jgi:hypothetical protein
MGDCIWFDGRRLFPLARLPWIIALTIVLPIAGCRSSGRPVSGVTVKLSILPQPVKVGPVTVKVQLADASRKPVIGANIQVEGDMSHPGMSPVFAGAIESNSGDYRAYLDFPMAGDWLILLHIRLADGRKLERQFRVSGVGTS